MINHLRTLLLNIDGGTPASGIPGEQYIPPNFQGLILTPSIDIARSALFGQGSDRAALNLQLQGILTLIHSGELEQYALALDPRVTYWPIPNVYPFRALSFGAAVKQTTGDVCTLYLGGDSTAPSTTNAIFQSWLVTVLNSTQVQVVQQSISPISSITSTYTITNGLSNSINLQGSNLSFIFTHPGAHLPSWEITALEKPNYKLLDAFNALLGANIESLISGQEPYHTLGKIWFDAQQPVPYKVAAAAIIIGYRINELYQNLKMV